MENGLKGACNNGKKFLNFFLSASDVNSCHDGVATCYICSASCRKND